MCNRMPIHIPGHCPKPTIGTRDSKRYRCCNHPDRPARLPSHVLCAECFAGLDAKMNALLKPAAGPLNNKEGGRHG